MQEYYYQVVGIITNYFNQSNTHPYNNPRKLYNSLEYYNENKIS